MPALNFIDPTISAGNPVVMLCMEAVVALSPKLVVVSFVVLVELELVPAVPRAVVVEEVRDSPAWLV